MLVQNVALKDCNYNGGKVLLDSESCQYASGGGKERKGG